MTEDIEQVEQYVQRTSRLRRRATLIFLIAVLIAAAVVLPPLINISRYQREITALMTRSLGRPVKLSSVKLRLLPRPGFVLTNLSVGESAEFGVEPILSAQTVVATIRLNALLFGRVEVDRINLDEASLNLVQSTPGRWNLESIMTGGLVQGLSQTAPTSTSAKPVFARKAAAFPYLEATNSRVNLKRGLEKYPYSLVNTQLSFWQDSPGIWRLRLRGQPARTDMEISAADTGDLRLEATLQMQSGHGFYEMPLKVQAEWREAQLGQLSRLLLGTDPGWRGDLTADLTMEGTANEAQTRGRLRATGVRRAEFVPASPMDFDINCGLLYEHTKRAVRNVDCDTEIGDGKLHLKADLPGESGQPEATFAVDQLPLQAGLDMLRTVRSGFAPGVFADGKVSGSLNLSPAQAVPVKTAKGHGPASQSAPVKGASGQSASSQSISSKGVSSKSALGLISNHPSTALQGSLTVADGSLRGGSFARPLALPKIVFAPAEVPGNLPDGASEAALSARFGLMLASPPTKTSSTSTGAEAGALPAHGQELAIRLQLTAAGYQIGVNGAAAPERLRELAYALGAPHSKELDGVAEGQADLQLMAAGPWVSSGETPAAVAPVASKQQQPAQSVIGKAGGVTLMLPGDSDALSGTIQLHRVAWSAPYLARPVVFPEAMVSLSGKGAPVNISMSGSFSYGALQGTASATGFGGTCAGDACLPQVQIHMVATDAETIEGALLGAPEKKSMLSPLIDRMRSSQPVAWPSAMVNLQAESLILGPVTLHKPVFAMKLSSKELTLQSWQTNLLGGTAKGDGSCAWNGNQLHYALAGTFNGVAGAQLGALLGRTAPAIKAANDAVGGDSSAGAAADKDKDEESTPAPAVDSGLKPAQGSGSGFWNGGPVDGSGKVELSGLTGKELAASATGTVHFHWVKGTAPISGANAAPSSGTSKGTASATAMHFDAWSGDAAIGSSKITLGSNTLSSNAKSHEQHASAVAGEVPFGGPARLTLTAAKRQEAQVKASPEAPKK